MRYYGTANTNPERRESDAERLETLESGCTRTDHEPAGPVFVSADKWRRAVVDELKSQRAEIRRLRTLCEQAGLDPDQESGDE